MNGMTCDACARTLLLDEDVRYVVQIDGRAAYDPLEITRADLARDLEAEMAGVLSDLDSIDADEAQDQVHRAFRYDLCPRCWKVFLADPIAGLRKEKSQGD